ncbi:uncharacterized protein LOC135812584 [Sycon ciliatum]|uniref:uncharacterized protein LOC135812584 n=1 Tax=Sycon ciliatum TaxID=27933 RepID=UPI0031F62052
MDAQEEPYPNSSGYVSDASTNWSSQTSPAEGLEVDSGERVLDLEKSITMLLTAGDVDAARSLFQFASFAKEAEHQGRISTQKEPAEQPPALHGHQSLQAEHRAQARQRDATRDATPAELALRAELDAMRAERDALRVQCDAARVESEAMRAQRDALWAKFHVGKQNQSGIVEFAARSLLPPKSVGRPQGSSIAEALYEKASLRGTVGEEARYSLIIGPPPPSLPNPKANWKRVGELPMAGKGHYLESMAYVDGHLYVTLQELCSGKCSIWTGPLGNREVDWLAKDPPTIEQNALEHPPTSGQRNKREEPPHLLVQSHMSFLFLIVQFPSQPSIVYIEQPEGWCRLVQLPAYRRRFGIVITDGLLIIVGGFTDVESPSRAQPDIISCDLIDATTRGKPRWIDWPNLPQSVGTLTRTGTADRGYLHVIGQKYERDYSSWPVYSKDLSSPIADSNWQANILPNCPIIGGVLRKINDCLVCIVKEFNPAAQMRMYLFSPRDNQWLRLPIADDLPGHLTYGANGRMFHFQANGQMQELIWQ